MNSAGEPHRMQEPVPRETELPFEPYPFATTARRSLPIPEGVTSAPTLEVLHRRRSRRTFGPLSDEQLSSLLWFAAKTLATSREASGFHWQHRPAPSGGGRHPVHILVMAPAVDPFAVFLYEPEGHALLALDISSEAAARAY